MHFTEYHIHLQFIKMETWHLFTTAVAVTVLFSVRQHNEGMLSLVGSSGEMASTRTWARWRYTSAVTIEDFFKLIYLSYWPKQHECMYTWVFNQSGKGLHHLCGGVVSDQGASVFFFLWLKNKVFDKGNISDHVNEGTVTQVALPFVMLTKVCGQETLWSGSSVMLDC